MTSSFTRAALLAGVMTLASVAVAVAQTPPPGADGAPRVERRVVVMGGPGGGMHGPGMGHRMDPAAHAQHLRDVLQLRPDQEAALTTFLGSMHPQSAAGAPQGGHGPGHHPDKPKTTPERLDMAAKMMAEHQAMFQKHAAAVRTFYAQLTPAQQKAFDALHMGMGKGMGGMHGRGMRMMHPGGPDMPGADD